MYIKSADINTGKVKLFKKVINYYKLLPFKKVLPAIMRTEDDKSNTIPVLKGK